MALAGLVSQGLTLEAAHRGIPSIYKPLREASEVSGWPFDLGGDYNQSSVHWRGFGSGEMGR